MTIFKMNGIEMTMETAEFCNMMAELAKNVVMNNGNWKEYLAENFEIISIS